MVIKYTISGWKGCGFFKRAQTKANELLSQGKILVELMEFPTQPEYKANLEMLRGLVSVKEQPKAANHTSSPFVFKVEDEGEAIFVGGCDDFLAEAEKL